MVIRLKEAVSRVCYNIPMILALTVVVSCAREIADGDEAINSVSAVKQALSDSDAENTNHSICNRPPPDLPLDFASADRVTIDGDKLVIPARIRENKDPSGFKAKAAVFTAETSSTVALKLSSGVLSSKGVVQIPIKSIVPSGNKTEGPITFAIEVTGESGESAWSDTIQIERVDKASTVRAYDSQDAVLVTRARTATTIQGDLPPVPSPRPRVAADETLEKLKAAGISFDSLVELADRADVERSAPIADTSGVTGGEAMAAAAPTYVCIQQYVRMRDESILEDYLQTDNLYPSGGAFAGINGSTSWWGFLDIFGCMPLLNLTTGLYAVGIWSASCPYWASGAWATVDTDSDGDFPLEASVYLIIAGITNYIDIYPVHQEHFNISLMAAYALHFNPGIAPVEYPFHAHSTGAKDPSGNIISAYNATGIHIKKDDGNSKWLVGHEMGHAFQDKNTSNYPPFDYWIAGAAPCDAGGHDGHNYDSMEYVTTSFGEAFASFYGAAAFNEMTETNCRFGPMNCADGQPPILPLAYMENECTAVAAYPNKEYMGAEVDWLRQLWRVRTWGVAQPTTNDMLNWINSVGTFTNLNAYSVLDYTANSAVPALNDNWDDNKIINGIDH